MARINAFSKSSLIALVSDTARDLGQTQRYAGFTSWIERVGLDAGTPQFITTLMRDLAAKDAKITALEAKLASVSAEVVAWDRDDMAVSAAMAADVPVGRHAVKATRVWDLAEDMVPVIATRTGLTGGQVKSLAAQRNALMLTVLPGGPAELAALIAQKAARDAATVYGVTGAFYARIRAGQSPAEILAWLTDSKRGA